MPPELIELLHTLKQLVPLEVKQYVWAAMTVWQSPSLWVLLAGILVWERISPADAAQPILSAGLGQDFMWFNVDIAVNVALVPAMAGGIRMIYDRITGGQILDFTAGWPVAVRVVVAVLVVDFLFYWKHRMLHRVTPLWHVHTIHHSQRELNALTDRHQHILEYLVSQLFVFLPLIALGLRPVAVMTVGAALWWHTILIHGNIRSDFGWLGRIFVSPQYHRIHHSIEPRHRDRNFGAFVTFWDRMFGTLYVGEASEYPHTGVEAVEFPPPRGLKPHLWVADLARQTWYPFRRLLEHGESRAAGPARTASPIPVRVEEQASGRRVP